MAVGSSGRIVVEIEPELKRELYDALHKEGKGLKQWFLENAEEFLRERSQLSLFEGQKGHHSDEIQS